LERLFLAFELVRGLDLLDAGFDELSVHVCLLEDGLRKRKANVPQCRHVIGGLFNTKNSLSNSNLYHIGFMYHIADPDIGHSGPL
jgi:hypothetical protein